MNTKKKLPTNHLSSIFYTNPNAASMVMTKAQYLETISQTQGRINVQGITYQIKAYSIEKGNMHVELKLAEAI